MLVIITFIITTGNQGLGANLPQMWSGTNATWQDVEITSAQQTVISIPINKQAESSILKINFSGGRLSFTSIDGLNSQAVLLISLDNVNRAVALNSTSSVGFRNQYAMISTIIQNVPMGSHTVAVKITKTSNPGEGGLLTYTTNIGQQINTYMASLTVEEWPLPTTDLSGVNSLMLLDK